MPGMVRSCWREDDLQLESDALFGLLLHIARFFAIDKVLEGHVKQRF